MPHTRRECWPQRADATPACGNLRRCNGRIPAQVLFESTGRTSKGKAVELEDVKFHQCVRLSRFENDRTISFIPPDGEFELMSYRLSNQVT
jgi:hypothetical protein